MDNRVPTRTGDGSLVHLTPGEIEADVRAGVEVAVKRAKVPPRNGGEAAEDEYLHRFLHSSQ